MIKLKVIKYNGDNYALKIPKAFIDSSLFKLGKLYNVDINDKKSDFVESITEKGEEILEF